PPPASEDVRWVQSALNQVMGIDLAVNGIMGPATRNAVRDFQTREGLPVDGIVGPQTREALARAQSAGGAPASPDSPPAAAPEDNADQMSGEEIWVGELSEEEWEEDEWED